MRRVQSITSVLYLFLSVASLAKHLSADNAPKIIRNALCGVGVGCSRCPGSQCFGSYYVRQNVRTKHYRNPRHTTAAAEKSEAPWWLGYCCRLLLLLLLVLLLIGMLSRARVKGAGRRCFCRCGLCVAVADTAPHRRETNTRIVHSCDQRREDAVLRCDRDCHGCVMMRELPESRAAALLLELNTSCHPPFFRSLAKNVRCGKREKFAIYYIYLHVQQILYRRCCCCFWGSEETTTTTTPGGHRSPAATVTPHILTHSAAAGLQSPDLCADSVRVRVLSLFSRPKNS